jgi:hypothetical protein
MTNGLNMTKEQFLKLPKLQRDACIFENISEIRSMIKGYKFWYRLYTVVSGFLLAATAFLFTFVLNNVRAD